MLFNQRNEIVAFFIIPLVLYAHVNLWSVNGSTIKRSLADDIRNGMNIAGKIFGFDTATNVAELVARAFSNQNSVSANNNDKITNENSLNLEQLENESDDPENQENTINDAIENVGNNFGDYNFLGNILKVLGMDNSKIGALAINGIIFIAQMIGRSLASTFGGVGSINIPTAGSRQFSDNNRPRSLSFENPFDWILNQQTNNEHLSNQMVSIHDKTLPERLAKSIDDKSERNDSTKDCIKLLLCKSAPFVWGMQRAITTRTSNKNTDPGHYEDEVDENDGGNDTQRRTQTDNRLDGFFKHMPSVDEFKSHGDACEARYTACNIFS